MRTRHGRILSMPYPIECNDTRGIVWYRHTTEEFADMIVDAFDEMLEQSTEQSLVCPISLHPFVVGRPYRMRRLRKALEHIAAHRHRVWITRPRDICAHIESLPDGVRVRELRITGRSLPARSSANRSAVVPADRHRAGTRHAVAAIRKSAVALLARTKQSLRLRSGSSCLPGRPGSCRIAGLTRESMHAGHWSGLNALSPFRDRAAPRRRRGRSEEPDQARSKCSPGKYFASRSSPA